MEGAADVLAPEGIAALASFVIRPPRATYSRRDLGEKGFMLDDARVTRTDVELLNAHNQRLQCSHFEPANATVPPPAVVYLHGNGSCRVEAALLLQYVVPHGMSMFAFDFSGSGRSDGEYITLGVREKDDVAAVVDYLVTVKKVPRVALWGHSMGAATALMYAGLRKDAPAVSAIVVDSAFQSFEKLAEAMVGEMPLPPAVPRKLVLSIGSRAVRRNVRERANFDVYDIDPLSAVKKISAANAPPAFFVHGMQDSIVPPSHSAALFAAYPGRKSVRYLPNLAHDTPRPDDVLEAMFEFLQRALSPDGIRGTPYLMHLKSRGNLCMLAGRYQDAAFLYTAALDALANTAVGCDFATATGNVDPHASPSKSKSSLSRRRTNFERRRADRASTASNSAPKRRWRSRFTRHSSTVPHSVGAGALSDPSVAVPTAPDLDDEPSGLSSGSAAALNGTSGKNSRAKSFILGIRARIHPFGTKAEERRRSRSGRFSSRNSGLGDRRDEFRSLGSGTDLRRSDVMGPNETPSVSRRSSADGVSGHFTRESGAAERMPSARTGSGQALGDANGEPAPRKSFGRFRRSSQSPSVAEFGEHVANGGIHGELNGELKGELNGELKGEVNGKSEDKSYSKMKGIGKASGKTKSNQGQRHTRGMPRFSHDGWRRRRQPRVNVDGPHSSTGAIRMTKRVPRSASVDLNAAAAAAAVPRTGDVAQWALSNERKTIALALLGNRSLARRKLRDANAALLDAVQCLRLDPMWMRGYLRKAAALRQAGRLEAARDAIADGLGVDPAHKQLIELLTNVDDALAERKRLEQLEAPEPPAAAEAEAHARRSGPNWCAPSSRFGAGDPQAASSAY